MTRTPCPYCDRAICTKWCTRFGMQDPTVKLAGLKPLDIAFKKLDNELVRRPLKTISTSLLLDYLKES